MLPSTCLFPKSLVTSVLLYIFQRSLSVLGICDYKYLSDANTSFVSSALSLWPDFQVFYVGLLGTSDDFIGQCHLKIIPVGLFVNSPHGL